MDVSLIQIKIDLFVVFSVIVIIRIYIYRTAAFTFQLIHTHIHTNTKDSVVFLTKLPLLWVFFVAVVVAACSTIFLFSNTHLNWLERVYFVFFSVRMRLFSVWPLRIVCGTVLSAVHNFQTTTESSYCVYIVQNVIACIDFTMNTICTLV